MIDIKTKDEIEKMRIGGGILAKVLFEVLHFAKPGVTELELDSLAEKLIRQKGAEPAFQKVQGYKHAICISTNDVVVHGVPTTYKLKEGDVVGIDCGVYYEGFNTDMAETIRVARGPVSSFPPASAPLVSPDGTERVRAVGSLSTAATPRSQIDKFLEVGKKSLWEAIKQARIGNRVGHISKAIQDRVEGSGYSVVESLIGHGVGKNLHEDPEVPGRLAGRLERTPYLKEGMTIAIEVIYNMGKKDVLYANKDRWTIKTADSSISGLFERTVAITKEGPVVLTK